MDGGSIDVCVLGEGSGGAVKAKPYRCERCLDEGSYVGLLRFPDDPPPVCKQHGREPEQWVEMEPVKKENQ